MITVATIQTELNSSIGDTSTDRISAAERLQAISEACIWVQEELANDLQNYTYSLDYYDTINYYKVTSDIADLLEGGDLRREKDKQLQSFTHKSSREMAEDIAQGSGESSWTIERKDTDTYVGVNHHSTYGSIQIGTLDSTTADSGTWTIDTTNSDATNLTSDTTEFKQGAGCLNFDIDVSQSANNRATIINSTYGSMDWSSSEDLTANVLRAYIPDVTDFTSFTVFWGTDSSNYWSATTTTDINSTAWVDGWNRFKVEWEDATATGSPDSSDIGWLRVDFNYGAGQGDDTDYRLDDWKLIKPENLTFHYITWKVGVDNADADIFKFAATTDVPYFSGMYDNIMYPVAHKAASIIFRNLRLKEESAFELSEADKALTRVRKLIPSSRAPEVKNFKVFGVSFNKRR